VGHARRVLAGRSPAKAHQFVLRIGQGVRRPLYVQIEPVAHASSSRCR